MRIRGILVLFFVLLCGVATLHAASITVSVVQTENAPEVALDMSRTVEDELLGEFFNTGHIVTNTDIRFDGSQFGEPLYGVKEAAFGYSDYLLVVLLTYGSVEQKVGDAKPPYAQLLSLTWKLVEVGNSAKIAERSIDVTKIMFTEPDPYQQARFMVNGVYPDIEKVLQKYRTEGKNK